MYWWWLDKKKEPVVPKFNLLDEVRHEGSFSAVWRKYRHTWTDRYEWNDLFVMIAGLIDELDEKGKFKK
jgi:hypothetical protein